MLLRHVTRLPSISRSLSTSKTVTYQSLKAKDASVNSFVSFADDAPISDGPLNGCAIAIKDNICTSSLPTTCSSSMLQNFISPFDATVVKLLREAGAHIVGKTNCDEFGMGSLNVHSVHGPVVNPFQTASSSSSTDWEKREKRAAGGSSGGSAAAVAAGLCHAALATDTGGSIRLPASYCGVAGLKSSYGLVSRWGVVSYADSLDCVGVIAREVSKIAEVFGLLNKHDAQDPTSQSTGVRTQARNLGNEGSKDWYSSETDLKGLTIGIPQEYFPREMTPSITQSVRRVVASLQLLGAKVIPVSLPSTSYALSAYYVIASAEASSNLARYDGIEYGLRVAPPPELDLTQTSKIYAHTRSRGFGPEVQKRILLGTYALTADAFDNYFLQAQRVRQMVRDDFDRVFRYPNVLRHMHAQESSTNQPMAILPGESRADVLLHPSAIQTAPRLADDVAVSAESGLDSYVQDVLTVPASLAGLPALSVPVPPEDGDEWPVGVSVVGQWGCDDVVLRVGALIERILR